VRRALLLLAVLAWVLPWAAAAAPGDVVESVYPLARKQVPLPPGPWIVAAEATEVEGRDAVAVRILAQSAGGTVTGLIVARANLQPRTAVYGASIECERRDIYLAYVAHDTPYDGLCGFINLIVLAPEVKGPPGWAEARAYLQSRGLVVPQSWLQVGHRARTVQDVLDVRYYLRPPGTADSAAPWADNPWTPRQVARDPERATAVGELGAWAAWTRDAVQDGLRGRIAAERLPPKPWGEAEVGSLLIERRIQMLDALRAEGAIDETSYARQRQQLAELVIEPERAEMTIWRKAFLKTVSYRVLSLVDGVFISWIFLDNWLEIGAFTAANLLLRAPVQYVHDITWEYFGVGRRAAPARTRELAEIGHSR